MTTPAHASIPGVARLRNTVRTYAWGSTTALADLQGREPGGRPEAELWIGAHPLAPSEVCVQGTWQSLEACIQSDPLAWLGEPAASDFSGRLPFLLKVLAVARPLSIQAHPNLEQARAGFARESKRGLAADDPRRSYRDDNHKPELICALTEFRALKGFRSPDAILELVRELGVAELERLFSTLAASGPDALRLRAVVEAWLGLSAKEVCAIVDGIRCAGSEGQQARRLVSWLLEIAESAPGDPGCLGPLFLNDIVLAPGEALFLPAGELHCYLEGVGVELMANSDNVLRGGLTSKHVDLSELLRVLRFAPGDALPLRLHGERGMRAYATPAREFELAEVRVAPGRVVRVSPVLSCELLLCTSGRAKVVEGSREVDLPQGAALVIPARTDSYELFGEAQVFRASLPNFGSEARAST